MLPAVRCCFLTYSRCHRYTHPFLHHSPTRLLLFTLCWPPSWAVGMLGLGPATSFSGRIPRFDHHVSGYMLDVLYWLLLQQWILYQIITLVWKSMLDLAPAYLCDLCCPTISALSYNKCTLSALLSQRMCPHRYQADTHVLSGWPFLFGACSPANILLTFYTRLKTVLFSQSGGWECS